MPVPDFSPGEVLTAAAMDSIGLWLVKTQTIGTAVSSVTVSNAFSANYDNYKIVISGGVGSTSGSVAMRLGGSTTGYYAMLNYSTYPVNSISGFGVVNGTYWTYAGAAGANNITMNVELNCPFLAKTTSLYAQYSDHGTSGAAGSFNGFHNVATSYTDFTLIPVGATLTGGTIRVYGYRN